jgi:hypothetical protein
VLPYFVVAGLYLLLWNPALLGRRAAWLAIVAFVAGSLPFWVYNLEYHFATFRLLTKGGCSLRKCRARSGFPLGADARPAPPCSASESSMVRFPMEPSA